MQYCNRIHIVIDVFQAISNKLFILYLHTVFFVYYEATVTLFFEKLGWIMNSLVGNGLSFRRSHFFTVDDKEKRRFI